MWVDCDALYMNLDKSVPDLLRDLGAWPGDFCIRDVYPGDATYSRDATYPGDTTNFGDATYSWDAMYPGDDVAVYTVPRMTGLAHPVYCSSGRQETIRL